jgi:flavin-dependent dehydrogenase
MRSLGGNTTRWDIIVVGAGPAGSAAAALLARAGLAVLLLEKAVDGLSAKVCGEYLSPGCLPMLQRLGALPSLLEVGRPLYGMVLHTAAGRVLRATYSSATFPPEKRVHGLSLGRAQLDPLLLDLAVKSGAVVESGFQASDVRWEGSLVAVRGRLHGCDAGRQAHLVIGADGRYSAVARRLGPVRRHPWLDKMALIAYLEGVEREGDFAEIFLGRDRYAILNPIADDLTNLGVVLTRRDLPRGEDPRQSLWSMARRLPGLGHRLRDARFAAPPRCLGPLAHRATRLSGSRALLVGDAAGFLDPFTGEGIYAALRSAELAVHRILSGWTADGPRPDALALYPRDWKQEFDPKWKLCTGLQHAIRRPWLAEWIVARLQSRPVLASAIMAAVGDLVRMPTLRRPRPLPPLWRTPPRPGPASRNP